MDSNPRIVLPINSFQDYRYKPNSATLPIIFFCGKSRIRTYGIFQYASLAERWFQPLTHFSNKYFKQLCGCCKGFEPLKPYGNSTTNYPL